MEPTWDCLHCCRRHSLDLGQGKPAFHDRIQCKKEPRFLRKWKC